MLTEVEISIPVVLKEAKNSLELAPYYPIMATLLTPQALHTEPWAVNTATW